MLKESKLVVVEAVKKLEQAIKELEKEALNDYKIGLIDGIIIAIRMIEG